MDNEPLFEPLLFGRGDGNLRYYLFNYRTAPITPSELGLVLL
jgi:glycylpeptide N-tetradecanoyltransferase